MQQRVVIQMLLKIPPMAIIDRLRYRQHLLGKIKQMLAGTITEKKITNTTKKMMIKMCDVHVEIDCIHLLKKGDKIQVPARYHSIKYSNS